MLLIYVTRDYLQNSMYHVGANTQHYTFVWRLNQISEQYMRKATSKVSEMYSYPNVPSTVNAYHLDMTYKYYSYVVSLFNA